MLLLFLKISQIFLRASSQVGPCFIIIKRNFLFIPYEHLGSSLPSLMSMEPVDPFYSFNMPSPQKDYRMIIKAKRSLPSNRLPPPPSSSSYPDYEQTSVGIDREDEPAVVQAHQKKSRNFSGNNTSSYSLNT